MKISWQVVPPGGWRYQQGNTLLVSMTFALLVTNLREHRRNNHIPIGDCEEDIVEQIAGKYPQLIINGSVNK